MNIAYYIKRLQKLVSLKNLIARLKLKSCGKYLNISNKARLVNLKYVEVGDNFIMDEFAEIYCNPINNEIVPSLVIGDNVHLSKHCCIGCSNKVVLENDVRLAPYCHITDRNHIYTDVNKPIWKQPAESPGPVIIGQQTWLGFGVQVMPGVSIGKHCVIAAGSIVTKDIPDYSVAIGSPAKVIKQYNFDTQEWERTK
jgi:acetyltransferase-like isoleucine patch superfamily enzyme